MATSLGEWFFYAVSAGVFGSVIVGSIFIFIRALIELVRRLFESDDPN